MGFQNGSCVSAAGIWAAIFLPCNSEQRAEVKSLTCFKGCVMFESRQTLQGFHTGSPKYIYIYTHTDFLFENERDVRR